MSYTSKDGLLDAATGPGRKLVENFRLVVADEPNRGTLAVSDSTDFVMREYFGLRPVELLHRPGDVFSLTTETLPGKFTLEVSPDSAKGPLRVRHRRADGQVLYEVPLTYELPVSDMDSATPWAILIDLTSDPSSPTITSVPNLATWSATKTLEELLDWAVLIYNKSSTVSFGGLELRYGTSLSGGILSTQYKTAEGRALERKVRREASTTIAGQTAFSFVVNPGSPPTATLTGQGRLTFVRTGGAYTSVDNWTTTLTQTNPVLVATILPAEDQATGTDIGTGGVSITAEPWSAVAADGGAAHSRSVVLGHWDFAGPEGGMFYVRTVHGSVFQDGETFWLGRGAVLSDEEVARKYQTATFFEAPTDIENYKLSLGYDPSRYMWTKDQSSYLKGMQMVPSSDPDAPVGISAETLRAPFLDVRQRYVILRRLWEITVGGTPLPLTVSHRVVGPLQVNMYWGATPPERGNEYSFDLDGAGELRFQISENGGSVIVDIIPPEQLVASLPSPTPGELQNTLDELLVGEGAPLLQALAMDGRAGYIMLQGLEEPLPDDPSGELGWLQRVVSDDGEQFRDDYTTSGTAPFWTTLVDVQPGLFGLERAPFSSFRGNLLGLRAVDARGGVVEADGVMGDMVVSPQGLFDHVQADTLDVSGVATANSLDVTGEASADALTAWDSIKGPESTITRRYHPSPWLNDQTIDSNLIPTWYAAASVWGRWFDNKEVRQPRVIASGSFTIPPGNPSSLAEYDELEDMVIAFRAFSWEDPPVAGQVYEMESTWIYPSDSTDFSKPPPVGAFIVRAHLGFVQDLGAVVMLEVRLHRNHALSYSSLNPRFWPHLEFSSHLVTELGEVSFSNVPRVFRHSSSDRCILYSTAFHANQFFSSIRGYLTLYEYV